LREQFETLWPLLAEAVARYGPTHEKQHVWDDIESGRAQFWPGVNSAIVTEIITYPTGFKELLGWLAAGEIEEIKIMEQFVAGWAKENGCQRVRLTTREGFGVAFKDKGYRKTMVVLTREL